MTRQDDGLVRQREDLGGRTVQQIFVTETIAETAADGSGEERVAGEDGSSVDEADGPIRVTGRVHDADLTVAERQAFAVADRDGIARERAERRRVKAVDRDARRWERATDLGDPVDMVGMFVRDEDVVELDRRALQRRDDVARIPAGIDESRNFLLLEDEEIAVARVRGVDLMSDVLALLALDGAPAREGDVRQLARIEFERAPDSPRLVFAGLGGVLHELRQPFRGNAGARREFGDLCAASARRFADDVPEGVFKFEFDDHPAVIRRRQGQAPGSRAISRFGRTAE